MDGQGRVVRHLAAGVLGNNPPAPLLANSLSQSFAWDGLDDLGNAVAVHRAPGDRLEDQEVQRARQEF